LILPFSSSPRTAIFTNVRLMVEGGPAPARPFWCRTPQAVQQPVGAHVQEAAELVGLPARARRLVGARPALHVLDQVLGAARTEHLLVERLAAARKRAAADANDWIAFWPRLLRDGPRR
jgi:hypothetical protein